MGASTRKQNTDLSRIIGILFLEILAAILLLNLAGFAKQQRTQLMPEQTEFIGMTQIRSHERTRDPHQKALKIEDSFNDRAEKSLPKLAAGRYNARW